MNKLKDRSDMKSLYEGQEWDMDLNHLFQK